MKEINTIIDKIQSKQIQRIENRLKSKDKILIGKTIKFYRLYYGISQKELARRLWTSFQTIQKYENKPKLMQAILQVSFAISNLLVGRSLLERSGRERKI